MLPSVSCLQDGYNSGKEISLLRREDGGILLAQYLGLLFPLLPFGFFLRRNVGPALPRKALKYLKFVQMKPAAG